LKLGVILDGAGATADGWRRSGVSPNASVDINAYIDHSRRAEDALLDFIFIADTLSITPASPPHMLSRLEPLTLLSAVAGATSRIGLVATVSTLFTEPFTVARQLASLDLISHGRCAWNIVTSAVPAAALNHSRPGDFASTDRYRRATEHVAACLALWDSWEDDAFAYDKAGGTFFHREKLHTQNFVGEYFQVAGPLNIQRSKQGRPVLFQAGASGQGRDLAARYGDAIFAVASDMEDGKAYADDVRFRAEGFGRRPEDILFLPRISPIIGADQREVDALYRETTRLANIEGAVRAMEVFFKGYDFARVGLDVPFPDFEIPSAPVAAGAARGHDVLAYIETTGPEAFAQDARRRGLTVREAALEFMTPRTAFMGTPDEVADTLERWFLARAADGFIVRGGDFEAFSRLCIPILQERGLFRTCYEAETLRGNLGLAPAPNRHATATTTSAGEAHA
jgi:FMN-dependent oxidoreductase (nitrilotriacetate monooxygenase family)